MTKKILVTGCAGFIGFHTSKALLDKGYHVVGIDNLNDYYDVSLKEARLEQLYLYPGFTFNKQDIADMQGMETIWQSQGSFDGVVHLAAQAGVRHSLKKPFDYIHSNITGHLVLLELCRQFPVRHFVYASSSSVYGGNTKIPFSVEDKTDKPLALYGATKKADELMTHAYCHLFGMAATGLRFFTVYGPWGRPDMAAYLFASAIEKGEAIKVFNNGDMKRDFTYIDDIVAGIIGVLEADRKPGQAAVYNLGNNRSEPLPRYIELIEQAMGKIAEKIYLPMQDGDVKDTFADITASTHDFGFKPITPIEEGIPRFIEWFKDYQLKRKSAA